MLCVAFASGIGLAAASDGPVCASGAAAFELAVAVAGSAARLGAESTQDSASTLDKVRIRYWHMDESPQVEKLRKKGEEMARGARRRATPGEHRYAETLLQFALQQCFCWKKNSIRARDSTPRDCREAVLHGGEI